MLDTSTLVKWMVPLRFRRSNMSIHEHDYALPKKPKQPKKETRPRTPLNLVSFFYSRAISFFLSFNPHPTGKLGATSCGAVSHAPHELCRSRGCNRPGGHSWARMAPASQFHILHK